MKVSIIYIYYNTPREIIASIDSVKNGIGRTTYEIIIVDNHSSKILSKELSTNKKVIILKNKKNIGFGAGVNQASRIAKGEYLLVINPDTLFHKKSISIMLHEAERNKKIGVIGPKFVNESGETLQSVSGMPFLPGAIVVFSLLDRIFKNNPISKKYWMRNNYNRAFKVPAVGGACMLFRKKAFFEIKGFDEQFFLYFEEADICYRLKKAGYTVLYFPQAVITHLIGRSTDDKKWIQSQFEKSRFNFFRKYHGVIPAFIAEGLIRMFQPHAIVILAILVLSGFMNLYRIHDLMMFFGDFGRDYLAARDMLLTGKIPLLGIPSSVIWLHQGPLSIYFIGLSFIFANFHPVAPAIFYASFGVMSTYLVYLLGSSLFNSRVGLYASAFYATAPLVVMNARLPYHTAPIPFFALLFFYVFWKLINGNITLTFLLFLLLGILLQLELSNAVLFFVVALLWVVYKIPITKKIIAMGIGGFFIGIFPFILYDLTHNFVQTGGLLLWGLNRIRLFLGITTEGNATTSQAGNALITIWSESVRILSPASAVITLTLFLICAFYIYTKRLQLRKMDKNRHILLTLAWLLIPLIGYTVHAKPGTAYFPLIYPSFALLIGASIHDLAKRSRFVIMLFVALVIFNGIFLISNNYFLAVKGISSIPEFYGYGYGLSYGIRDEAASFIVNDARERSFSFTGGGFLEEIKTAPDAYTYLILYKGGKLSDKSQLRYVLYENKNEVPKGHNVVYMNDFIAITKHEK